MTSSHLEHAAVAHGEMEPCTLLGLSSLRPIRTCELHPSLELLSSSTSAELLKNFLRQGRSGVRIYSMVCHAPR